MDNSLKNLTTLKIGGPASEIIIVKSEEELTEAISHLIPNPYPMPSLILGGGSNLLVSDEGYDGVVIKNEIKGLSRNGNCITVKSGTPLQELVDFSIKEGLSGLQKLTGIPGTVGGALYGNAGAYGQTISDHLTTVKTLDTSAVIPAEAGIQSKDQCNFSYRSSIFKQNKNFILEATFELTPGNSEELKKESEEVLEKRLEKYPAGIKCPGSFFKNIIAEELPKEILAKIPEEKIMYGKIPAGTLLEEVGAKGDSIGDIEIASYHANLFINRGNGTATDFHTLAQKYHDKVLEKYGVDLKPEVQLVNLTPLKQN